LEDSGSIASYVAPPDRWEARRAETILAITEALQTGGIKYAITMLKKSRKGIRGEGLQIWDLKGGGNCSLHCNRLGKKTASPNAGGES